jgi:hypothetical protein
LSDLIYEKVQKISAIDPIKQYAKGFGWNGGKTERDRKFLSDLKVLLGEYGDLPFQILIKSVAQFYDSYNDVLLIDIREPAEIERAKIAFNAKTIFIKNSRVPKITSNMADAGVENFDYDIIIENEGTIEEFCDNVIDFIDTHLGFHVVPAFINNAIKNARVCDK